MNARFMAAVNGRRFLRDRTNLFFVFVFPIALVLIIGLQFSSSEDPKIGMVVGGEANQALADSMIEQIETSDIEVVDLADRDALVSDIENDQLDAGFVLPKGFGASVAAGEQVEVGYVARPDRKSTRLKSSH